MIKTLKQTLLRAENPATQKVLVQPTKKRMHQEVVHMKQQELNSRSMGPQNFLSK